MYRDTNSITDGETIKADICIIGSGPGAFSLALQFVDGAPVGNELKVVMIESEPDEQPIVLANRQSQDRDLGPCDVTDTLYPGKLAGFVGDGRSNKYLSGGFWAGRLRVYGGTSRHWGGWDWPLQPWDLGGRPFHQGLAWPFPFDELEDYYRRVFGDLMQLNHFEFDNPSFWIKTYPQLNLAEMPLPKDCGLQTRVLQFQAIAFEQQYGRRIAGSDFVDIYRNANALHFVTVADGSKKRATRLEVGSLDTTSCKQSKTWSVEADRYVICCGGIESTRLLLLNDLGNQGGQLGLTFMDNPYMAPGATFDISSTVPEGVRNFYFSSFALPGGPPYQSTFIAGLVPTREYLESNPEIGDFRILVGAVGSGLSVNTEQAPAPNSRISLATEDEMPLDLFGQRRVKVDWQTLDVNGSYPDTETLRRTIDLGCTVLQDELGYVSNYQPVDSAYQTREWWEWLKPNGGFVVFPGLHPQGSTRMSIDPAAGVVDANLRVHDTTNVYVSASSNFPTQGYQNPTFAVCALSVRLADQFKSG
jgi:choline dehydrogenase-like flavoprotein